MANVSKTEILSQTDDWVGTTFREAIEENGKSTEMERMVTGVTENKLLAMHLSGQYNTVDIQWVIESVTNGTVLTFTADVRFKGFMLVISTILLPVIRNGIMKKMNGELAELKRLCENG